MKTIGIVGLGLIGGSFAKAIRKNLQCELLGLDIDGATITKALDVNALDDVLTNKNINSCDMIILCLYPNACIEFMKNHLPKMKPGTIVVDTVGIKHRICVEICTLAQSYGVHFIGGHPMAGIEKSGFESSFAELFCGATMILCENEKTDAVALEDAKRFFLHLGFARVNVTTADIHDRVIAYTSQLAHIASNAYVKSDTLKQRYGFSAGSYKDLSRVAQLNSNMWTELFFENKDNLLDEIDNYITQLKEYKKALISGDYSQMKELLLHGSDIKIADDKEEVKWKQG